MSGASIAASAFPEGYRSGRGRTSAVVVTLWIGVGITVLNLIGSGYLTTVIAKMERGGEPDFLEGLLSVGVVAVNVFQLLCFVLSVVFVCVWLHGAVSNQRALDSSYLGPRPSEAVWSFFIPFVNLSKPYTIVRGLWTASRAPAVASDGEPDALAPTSTGPLPAWWALWLTGNVTGQISFHMSGSTLSGQVASMSVGIVSDVLHVGAAILLVRIVRSIEAHQDDHARRLATQRLPQPLGLSPLIH